MEGACATEWLGREVGGTETAKVACSFGLHGWTFHAIVCNAVVLEIPQGLVLKSAGPNGRHEIIFLLALALKRLLAFPGFNT